MDTLATETAVDDAHRVELERVLLVTDLLQDLPEPSPEGLKGGLVDTL